MKRTLHIKKNPLVLALLLIACLMLLTSCGIQNEGNRPSHPSLNETQVSSPSTSVLPTKTPTSLSRANAPSPMPTLSSVSSTRTSSTMSPPSLCPTNPLSLIFSTIVGKDSAAQQVTIANCGGPGKWTSSTSTSDGGNWLSSSPTKGWLDSGASQIVSITVASASRAAAYMGQVSFSLGSITVKMDIISIINSIIKPCVSRKSLSFAATQGQNDPAAQTVTLSNCGQTGSWSGSVSTNWLSINPTNGTLSSNASQDITVNATIANLNAGTYTGILSFTLGPNTAMVSVTLTVQPTP